MAQKEGVINDHKLSFSIPLTILPNFISLSTFKKFAVILTTSNVMTANAMTINNNNDNAIIRESQITAICYIIITAQGH